MRDQSEQNISGVLAAWKAGDAGALDRLVALLYPQLRRIARQHLERRRGESIESAALANETYLKLERAGRIECENRTHFLALCSQIMRRILVDYARSRGYAKRGGDAIRVPLDDVLLMAEAHGIEVLTLDQALGKLAGLDARKCRVVELRYFGGLTIEETAEALGISIDTAKRDWRMAKAWLAAELNGKPNTRLCQS